MRLEIRKRLISKLLIREPISVRHVLLTPQYVPQYDTSASASFGYKQLHTNERQ